MVLEATMLVLDNSEWMRNGDHVPSRLEAQADAAHLLFSAKTQSNPENTVGLMTMSGKGPEVHVTLTNDLGKILQATHHLHLQGHAQFSLGVQVAQLALKHRQNKNQRQRIIVFVGSPIQEDESSLVKLAKKLKKNNIAVDVVNFGEEQVNTGKLDAFIQAVNSSDNSHLVTVPAGPSILSDVLLSSPILQGEGGAPAGFGGGGAGFEFGFDPNMDPELALALKISMEEEKARQDAVQKASGEAAGEPMAVETTVPAGGMTDEDAMLAQAIAMSMEASGAPQTEGAGSASKPPAAAQDEQFMQSMLGSLPGVNPNDPRFKQQSGSQSDKKPSDSSKKQPSPKK